MVEVDRPVGHIAPREPDVEEGTVCPGCEADIPEDSGVECYCAAEDFSRSHELYKWCTQECFNETHEIPVMYPPDYPYDM